MAVMIPAECDLSRRPVSERIVFEAVKKYFSDDWKVFHSFDFVSRDLNRMRWDGEIDFLFYHPDKGILILEVKGGKISHRLGQWYQEDRPIDPFGQAKHNKYAVMKLLTQSLGRSIPLKFAHAVCFPGCISHTLWPLEAAGLIITGDGLSQLPRFVSRILDETPMPVKDKGVIESRDILQVLTPCFEYGQHLAERIGAEERQFFLFTDQQCAILNALENFPRLQICGCAGSGKTVMALKKARMLAEKGKNVLLLCFNQMLAEYLRKEIKDCPTVKAAAFFEYCIQLLNIPEEQVAKYRRDPRLYSKILPELLRQYLYRSCLYYDAVIVDEGQDFTREAWEVISLLPEEGGQFYVFYDPDQNIFNTELVLPDFGLPPVVLSKNCRNTRKIFEALTPYRSVAAEVMDSAPAGADVRVLHGNCRQNLAAELERLALEENVLLTDIVILGGHLLEHTSIGDDPTLGKFNVVSRKAELGTGEVSYYTYMKFKGCEAKVVILLDVDENDPRWADRSGIYTAMSRAVHQLVILYR